MSHIRVCRTWNYYPFLPVAPDIVQCSLSKNVNIPIARILVAFVTADALAAFVFKWGGTLLIVALESKNS